MYGVTIGLWRSWIDEIRGMMCGMVFVYWFVLFVNDEDGGVGTLGFI